MIKNYVEQIIEEILPGVLKEYIDICKCEKCVSDIKCITLNNLKPAYFDSEIGGVYLKLNSLRIQYKTDVVQEATKAIQKVSQNIHHY